MDYVYIRFPADLYAELIKIGPKRPMWVEELVENGMREAFEGLKKDVEDED